MTLHVDDIIAAIHASLSDDMLSSKWRRIVAGETARTPLSGHCAIAAEALYDLLGGAAAGYTPYVCSYHEKDGRDVYARAPQGYEPLTHWWLRASDGAQRGAGGVVDPTAGQYSYPFPYHYGQAAGFMSPFPPSQRARTIIARVERALGVDAVRGFRAGQVAAFQSAGGRVTLGIADLRRARELRRR